MKIEFKIQKHLKSCLKAEIADLLEEGATLDQASFDVETERIHRLRVIIKHLRAHLRLLKLWPKNLIDRARIKAWTHDLRKASGLISAHRDLDVLIESVLQLQSNLRSTEAVIKLKPVLHDLEREKQEFRKRRDQDFKGAIHLLQQLRSQPLIWREKRMRPKFASFTLKKSIQKARKAYDRSTKTGTDKDVHNLRKRLKDLQFQLETVVKEKSCSKICRGIKNISKMIGDDRDLTHLEQLVNFEEARSPMDLDLGARRKFLRSTALKKAEALFA